jgi:HprK-related kinase A
VTRQASGTAATLAEADTAFIAHVLSKQGLCLDLGATVLRVRSNTPALARQVCAVYPHQPLFIDVAWADLHVALDRPRGLRRWLAPQTLFRCDGAQPFEPFSADSPLPLLEWGTNWLIGQRLNHLLLLHAGAVEKGGRALLMPALPGSGKSTLTAALSLRGWRLLSDEFGAYDPADDRFRALLKPVALKNASIDVIRKFAPEAPIGPAFPKTRKGTVAHLPAEPDAVARRHEGARPGAFILPRWLSGSPTRLERVPSESLFGALAFNAFNYRLLGAVGFDAVVSLMRRCPAWQLVYSDLDDAIRAIDAVWPGVIDAHGSSQGNAVNEAGADV